jgi:hypothetical protein
MESYTTSVDEDFYKHVNLNFNISDEELIEELRIKDEEEKVRGIMSAADTKVKNNDKEEEQIHLGQPSEIIFYNEDRFKTQSKSWISESEKT